MIPVFLRGFGRAYVWGAILTLTVMFELFVALEPLSRSAFVFAVDAMLALAGFAAGASALHRYHRRGKTERSWLLIGIGCTLFGASQLFFAIEEGVFGHTAAQGFSPAQVLIALAVPTTLAGLVRLSGESGRGSLVAALDATIISLCCLIEGWILVLAPAYRAAESTSVRVTTMFYIGASLAMAAAVLVVATRWRKDPVSLMLLGAGFVWLSIASTAYGLKSARGSYATGDVWVDVGWFTPFLLIALAASRNQDRRGPRSAAVSQLSLTIPFLAVVVVLLTNFGLLVSGRSLDTFVQGVGGAMVLLVVIRQVLTLRELHAMTMRLEERVTTRTEDLRRVTSRLTWLIHNSSDVIAELDDAGIFRYASPAVRTVLGRVEHEVEGHAVLDLVHPEDRLHVAEVIEGALAGNISADTLTARFARADGQWCELEASLSARDDATGRQGLVVNLRDVTERVALEQEIRHQATYDSLTALVNRRMFHDRVRQGLARSARTNEPLSLLYVDLDHFKHVNDDLGHSTGDAVLAEFADRLRTCLRPSDTAARLGGDEFAVLLENTTDVQAHEVAGRIVSASHPSYIVDGRHVTVTASVGVNTASPGAASASDLMHDADLAMYRAKAAGRGQAQVFHVGMGEEHQQRTDFSDSVREALQDNDFTLVYQPVMDLATGAVSGLEALVRWERIPGQVIAPARFLPQISKCGLGPALDHWVLRQACREVKAWQNMRPGSKDLRVHVNLIESGLRHRKLADEIRDVLEEVGLAPEHLVVELSEPALQADDPETHHVLAGLRELGVHVLLDDFGTGATSLANLRSLPLDGVKIDSSLIEELDRGAGGRILVRGLLDIAHAMGLVTVAEGVERHRQHSEVRELGFGLAQGRYFAPPLAAGEVIKFLSQGRGRVVRLPDARPSEHLVSVLDVVRLPTRNALRIAEGRRTDIVQGLPHDLGKDNLLRSE